VFKTPKGGLCAVKVEVKCKERIKLVGWTEECEEVDGRVIHRIVGVRSAIEGRERGREVSLLSPNLSH
jgi:hypothetical protein